MSFAAKLCVLACSLHCCCTCAAKALFDGFKVWANRSDRQRQLHHAGKDTCRKQASHKGKTYRLGIETNKDTPAYPPRTFAITWCSRARSRQYDWSNQDDLQRRHHRRLGRHRLPARWPGPHRHRQSLLQLQQSRRFRDDRWFEETRRRERACGCDAWRAARHGRLLQHRHRQRRDGIQSRRNRRRNETAGHQVDRKRRRRAVLYRLAKADR